jgi:hypothetical protein
MEQKGEAGQERRREAGTVATVVKPLPPSRCKFLNLVGGDLAIDPGLHTGWAFFGKTDHRLLACGDGSPPNFLVEKLVIELPQVYPSMPVPPKDLITLAFMAGRYVSTFYAQETLTVSPHEWKGNLPKAVCASRVIQHLSKVEFDILERCQRVVPEKQMHNVLDAVGIGLVVFRKVKL